MTTKNKVAFWICAIGASFIFLIFSGLLGTVTGDAGEILVWVGLLATIATAYSVIFLLCVGSGKLLSLSKFRRVREAIGVVMASLSSMVKLAGGLALVAAGLYLGYLFVSWAGFIGTMLVLIAGLLFVIVLQNS